MVYKSVDPYRRLVQLDVASPPSCVEFPRDSLHQSHSLPAAGITAYVDKGAKAKRPRLATEFVAW